MTNDKIKIFFWGHDYFGGQFLERLINDHSHHFEIAAVATNLHPSKEAFQKKIKKSKILIKKKLLLSEFLEKVFFSSIVNKKFLKNPPPVYQDITVRELAFRYNIPAVDASIIYSGDLDIINSFDYDFIIIASFGKIPEDVYTKTKSTVINFHPSMLPQLKGGSPVYSAIMKQFECTGFTYHLLSQKFDSGPILYQEAVTISQQHTCILLEKEIIRKGANSLHFLLTGIKKGFIVPISTDKFSVASYCFRTYECSAFLQPKHSTSDQLLRQIKACSSWAFGNAYIRQGYRHFYISKASSTQSNISSKKDIQYIEGNGLLLRTSNGSVAVSEIYYKQEYYAGKDLMKLKGVLF